MQNETTLPENYQMLSKEEKQNLLWERIATTKYAKLPSRKPSLQRLLNAFNLYRKPDYTLKTITYVSDEFEPGRRKILHPFGTIAKMRFIPTDSHPFTGIFQQEAVGVMRASTAMPVNAAKGGTFIPGLALKFLIDGHPSLNIVAVHNLDGNKDYNFFSGDMSQIVPEPKKFFFKFIVRLAEPAIRKLNNPKLTYLKLPLDEFAKITSTGKTVQNPKVIYKLTLVPQIEIGINKQPDFRIKLQQLKLNTILYKCMAQENETSAPIYIGDIINTSEFIASQYGDEKLFFQHSGGDVTAKKCPLD